MGELNFVVDNTALETVRNTPITANFDEMKEGLKELVAPYRNMIVSEDAISSAKSDRARLRKVENNIDDYRKTVKKIYTEPLTLFESKCKELSAICKEASNHLDIQIKAFENKQKEEKKKALLEYFYEQASGYADYISFAEIFNEKWLNATFSSDSAKQAINEAIAKTASDVNCICGLASPFGETLLKEYTETKDLARVIQLNTRLTEQAKAEEERLRAKLEAEKQAAVEVAKKEAEAEPAKIFGYDLASTPANDAYEAVQENAPDPDFYFVPEDDNRYTVYYSMLLDPETLTALRLFLTMNNIIYTERFE